MSIFGGKDKKKQPEAVVEAPKEAPILSDAVAASLPQRSTYFNAVRTNAFVNHNLVENYVEFWAALQVDPAADKWRVMHYMVYDLDRKDGKFVIDVASKQDGSFAEAIAQVAKLEYTSTKLLSHADFDLEKQYPPDVYPEMKAHFYDIEHYKKAGNIEGFAFDEYGTPRRRIEGKVFAAGTYDRSEVVNTILAVEQARDNPKVAAKIEGGILSDLFATASDRAATLDNILKIGQVLGTMDDFATQVGAFYLSIQKAVKADDKFDKIEGLEPAEKADVLKRSQDEVPQGLSEGNAFRKILDNLIPQMNKNLDAIKGLGVHVEPFQKFTAEMELYTNLLYASQNLGKLERGFVSASNTDTNLITQIRTSVDNAQKKFLDLGGTQDQMDKLKAWVANPKKDPIPGWVPGFLTRYYTSRAKVMQKVSDRQAGLREVNTMSVEVKPPVTEAFNDNVAPPKKPEATEVPAATTSSRPDPADFDKYKNIVNDTPRPKRTP